MENKLTESKYNRENPFLSRLVEKFNLSKAGTEKNTHHVVLDIGDSGISYDVGDCVAILPDNDPCVVSSILHIIRANGDETVLDKKANHPSSLRNFLIKNANLSTVNKKLFSEVAKLQTNPVKKANLEGLLAEENKQSLKEYLEAREVWDFLLENNEIAIDPQTLVNCLMPLMPRFYSIASSMHSVKNEVHLTVGNLEYTSNGYIRRGVCTDFLLNRAKLRETPIPLYLQPHKGFTLPDNSDIPIIMIGPGTGVAPFRAFMQERLEKDAKGHNWLFFGERNRSHHFFYENFWTGLENQGKLRLDVAFSRDQEHKIYVQHRLLEKGGEIFQWLKNGAHLYVCGDAQRMAKDVEATLQKVIQEHGNLSEESAREYVKQLRAEKRYLRDVY